MFKFKFEKKGKSNLFLPRYIQKRMKHMNFQKK